MEDIDFTEYIVIDPRIRFGKPTIKGTRISVCDILEWLAAGMSNEEILEDFPYIEEKHIFAALAFAARNDEMTKTMAVYI
jgi:uncharacterized protein (DUF433 family)